jgi:hypothetical protein
MRNPARRHSGAIVRRKIGALCHQMAGIGGVGSSSEVGMLAQRAPVRQLLAFLGGVAALARSKVQACGSGCDAEPGGAFPCVTHLRASCFR